MIYRFLKQAAALIAAIILSMPLALAAGTSVTNTDVLPVTPSSVDIFNPTATAPASTRVNPNNAVNLLEVGPARVMTIILSLFTLVSIVIAIYAGVTIIFSGGDQKKVEKGVKTLAYAAIGMLVVGAAWLIVRLVLNIDVTSIW